MEQLLGVTLRKEAVRINQWGEAKMKIPIPGCMSSHLYKGRKGGPAAMQETPRSYCAKQFNAKLRRV